MVLMEKANSVLMETIGNSNEVYQLPHTFMKWIVEFTNLTSKHQHFVDDHVPSQVHLVHVPLRAIRALVAVYFQPFGRGY